MLIRKIFKGTLDSSYEDGQTLFHVLSKIMQPVKI